MDTKERLQKVEKQLTEMGVKSVKLSLSPGCEGALFSTLLDSVADFLEKYISGVSVVDVTSADDIPTA